MKKRLIVLLALISAMLLAACGAGSADPEELSQYEHVKSLIEDFAQHYDVYTDGSEESEAFLAAVEEQYALLSEDEQARLTEYVRARYPELFAQEQGSLADETEAAPEPGRELCGSWVSLYGESVFRPGEENGTDYDVFEFRFQSGETMRLDEDGKAYFNGEEGEWTYVGPAINLKLGSGGGDAPYRWMIRTLAGVTELFSEDLNLVLVKEEDYPRLRDEMFVTVELTEDNFFEYFDKPVLLPYLLNDQNGNKTDYNSTLVFFPGRSGDNGLIYLGSTYVDLDLWSESFGEVRDRCYTLWGMEEAPAFNSLQFRPYVPIMEFYDEQTHTLNCEAELLSVRGSFTFVRQEFVDEVGYECEVIENDNWNIRFASFVRFRDGFLFVDGETGNVWDCILDPRAEDFRYSY